MPRALAAIAVSAVLAVSALALTGCSTQPQTPGVYILHVKPMSPPPPKISSGTYSNLAS